MNIEERLHFEMLLSDLCTQFVNVAPSEVDSKIEGAQRVICEYLGVNHSCVWQVSEENPDLLVMTHAYRDPNLKPRPSMLILNEHFPWSQSQILNKQIVCVPDTRKVTPEAATDRKSCLQYGIRSALAFPLSVGGGPVIGSVAFDSTEERDWPESLQRRLLILAHAFAQALDRKTSEKKTKMADEALRKSEEQFRLAAQAGRMYAYTWDVATDVIVRSGNASGVLGSTRETPLTRRQTRDRVHPDDRAIFDASLSQHTLENPDVQISYRMLRPDGSVVWVEKTAHAIFDKQGRMVRAVGMVADITERKRAEEALRASEERLRLAQRVARIGTFDWNTRTDVSTWTPELEALYGLQPGDFGGTNAAFESWFTLMIGQDSGR